MLEPFQSPLGTKSKDTHTEAKVGASRESLAQVGVGREAKAAAREHCSCPGGLSGSSSSSFHPALKTLSFPVQDRCCGHELRCGRTERRCVGRSPTAVA